MTAQQMNVDNIANNLANANTAGYKARRAQFQDLLYQNMVQPGASAGQQTVVPTGLQLGLGTRAASNEIVFTQGNFRETDNPLDLVIQGSGFFQVRRPSGELAYTRAGSFQLDRDGNMVTANGNPLEPQITHSGRSADGDHRRRRNGQLHAAGQTAAQKAGQIQLANFQNPAGLNSSAATCTLPPTPRAIRRWAIRAARKGSARCCRATPSNPTSASSRSSST